MSENHRSTVNHVYQPLIAWSKNKYVSADAESLWTGQAHGIGYCAEQIESALTLTYTDDAHLVTYLIPGRRWQPRIRKSDLPLLREHGLDVHHHVLVADVDRPDHQRMSPEAIEDARGKLAQFPTIGWYTSRAGLRILQPLTRPVSPEHYEHAIGLWLPELQAVLGDAWVVDRNCRDWTRHFRLPYVVRDGVETRPTAVMDLSRMTRVEPCPTPPPRPVRAVEDRRRPTRTSTDDHKKIVQRAKKYASTIECPKHGTGTCGDATWDVACHLVKGFLLDEDEALGIITDWASGMASECDHRKPENLRRKIASAAKTSTRPDGYLLQTDRPSRPARVETTDAGPGFSVVDLDEEEQLAAFLAEPPKGGDKAPVKKGGESDDDAGGGKKGGLTAIIGRLRFFRILTGRVFTVIDGEAVAIDSERYIEWVASAAYRVGRIVATRDKIKTTTTAIVGPRNRLPLRDAPIRYAYDPSDLSIWIDLADAEGRTVHVTLRGATVHAKGECPIAWYRPDGTAPMPVPEIPKDADECRAQWGEFWAFGQRESIEERVAAFAWLLSAARPMANPQTGTLTRYAVGAMTGEHGAGKTSAMEILRTIVDPRKPGSVNLPKAEKLDDMTIHAEQVAVLAYDNASHLTGDHSDHLCRIATGAGSVKRSLYCDRDLSVFLGSRPMIINGITDIITRDDLLDRSVLIKQTKPKVLKPDSALAREWARIYPRVLGALVHCMSAALAHADETTVDASIRMIEAAQWAAAAEQDAGFETGSVSACYMATREHATDMAAEDTLITALMEIVPAGSALTDSATGILKRLLDHWEEGNPKKKPPEDWPRSPNKVKERLDRRKSALEALGLSVSYATGQRTDTSSSARTITLSRAGGAKAPLRLVVDNTTNHGEAQRKLIEECGF